MPRKWIHIASLAGLLPASGLTVAFSAPGIITPSQPPGTVAYVTQGSIISTIAPSGVLQDTTDLSLNFSASGLVDRVLVSTGQHVKAGQLLATLSDPQLQNTVNNDKISLNSAEANLAKVKAPPTAASVQIAQASLDEAKAKLAALQAGGSKSSVAQAQATLDQARSKLAALLTGTKESVATASANLDSGVAPNEWRGERLGMGISAVRPGYLLSRG